MTSKAIKLFGPKSNQPDPGRPLLDAVDKMNPSWQGEVISLEAKIAYPGSRVTDIVIGNSIYKVLNTDLAKAKCL
jgi:hypothetical protein